MNLKKYDFRPGAASVAEQRAAIKAGGTGRDAVKGFVKGQTEADKQIVCPQCQTRGHVVTRQAKVKRGISGGKAAGAVLTAGISVIATGLSRKNAVTEAHCSNCKTVWQF